MLAASESRVQISCAGPWNYRFGLCVVDLILASMNAHAGGKPAVDELWVHHKMGSLLPQLRHQAVRDAFARNATHLCFIDTDQTFAPTTLIQLLSHRLPIIGANVATKMLPANPTARKKNPDHIAGDLVYTGKDSPAVEKVWRLGFGVTLIEMEVFKRLSAPWFEVRYRHENDDYQGEDWFFFDKVEEARIGVYVDHLVSEHVGHVGEYVYTHADTLAPGKHDVFTPDLITAFKKVRAEKDGGGLCLSREQ